MTKRSIDAFHPRGLRLDERIYSQQDIDQIIAVSGGLPADDVQHWRPAEGDGELDRPMVARRVALMERLESAAKWWQIQAEFRQKPTPSQLKERLANIEQTARQLLDALGIPKEGDLDLSAMPPALRFDGLQAEATIEAERLEATIKAKRLGGLPAATGAGLLEDAIRGVYCLKIWAARAGETEDAKGGTPRTKRHNRDEALDGLIAEFIAIWVGVFEKAPKTSVGAPETQNEGKAGGPLLRFIDACLAPLLGEKRPSAEAIRGRVRRTGKLTGEIS